MRFEQVPYRKPCGLNFMQLCRDICGHRSDHGYTEVSVPLLVTRSSLEGTGQLPKFEEDLFKTNHLVSNEDSFLIPTGEVPLTNLLRGQLLDKSEVRLKSPRHKIISCIVEAVRQDSRRLDLLLLIC